MVRATIKLYFPLLLADEQQQAVLRLDYRCADDHCSIKCFTLWMN